MKFKNEYRKEVVALVHEQTDSFAPEVTLYRFLHTTDSDHQTMLLTAIEADAIYQQLGRLLRKGQ